MLIYLVDECILAYFHQYVIISHKSGPIYLFRMIWLQFDKFPTPGLTFLGFLSGPQYKFDFFFFSPISISNLLSLTNVLFHFRTINTIFPYCKGSIYKWPLQIYLGSLSGHSLDLENPDKGLTTRKLNICQLKKTYSLSHGVDL